MKESQQQVSQGILSIKGRYKRRNNKHTQAIIYWKEGKEHENFERNVFEIKSALQCLRASTTIYEKWSYNVFVPKFNKKLLSPHTKQISNYWGVYQWVKTMSSISLNSSLKIKE
jgi:hypothetical protein